MHTAPTQLFRTFPSTPSYSVDLQYEKDELRALFDAARQRDVEKGGRYDARRNAINVWSHPWTSRALREESTIIGTFYCTRGAPNRIYQLEIDMGFTLDDLLGELGTLESDALGAVKYGQAQLPRRSI